MIPKHDPSREHHPDNHDEELTDDTIVHFVLAGLLPPGHILPCTASWAPYLI